MVEGNIRIRANLITSTLVFLIFLLAFFTFLHNQLSGDISGVLNPLLPMSSYALYILIIIFAFAIIFMDIGKESKLRTILYFSWAFYLPSALYFSRIDMLQSIGSPINFSDLASDLPSFVLILAGMALMCGELLLRSLGSIQEAGENFIARGADPTEVRSVLDKNMAFEISTIAGSACIVMTIILIVPAVEPMLLGIMRSTEYSYLILVIVAVIVLIMTILAYAWPSKNSEKR